MMNIEEFYDSNKSRRTSDETCYGTDWRSADDRNHAYDLYWVAATGEIYLMRKPDYSRWKPPLVSQAHVIEAERLADDLENGVVDMLHHVLHPRHMKAKLPESAKQQQWSKPYKSLPEKPAGDTAAEVLGEELTVEILARIHDKEEVEKALQGWQAAMASDDGVSWLRQRVNI
ncbi:MAG: hypothetical protein M1350_06460 [Actinobacteria bacterium]|nr:hypothetical protein [Actinomycetota bacterium]